MTQFVLKRDPRILAVGSLLVIAGSALLLDRLDMLSLRWDKVFWVAGLVSGALLVADGFARKKRGRTFWGGAWFFTSLYFILVRFQLIERYDYPLVPVLFIAFGLSFLVLFFLDVRETTILVPAFLFGGTGTLAMFWWWEIFGWRELQEAVATYWPLILILWGLTVIVRRKPSA